MRKFFNITKSYEFDWGDVDAITSFIHLVLIITIGFCHASFFGVTVSVLGIGRDLFIHRRINGLAIHLTTLILNFYFLLLLFGKIC